jgi:hypothetical protein
MESHLLSHRNSVVQTDTGGCGENTGALDLLDLFVLMAVCDFISLGSFGLLQSGSEEGMEECMKAPFLFPLIHGLQHVGKLTHLLFCVPPRCKVGGQSL